MCGLPVYTDARDISTYTVRTHTMLTKCQLSKLSVPVNKPQSLPKTGNPVEFSTLLQHLLNKTFLPPCELGEQPHKWAARGPRELTPGEDRGQPQCDQQPGAEARTGPQRRTPARHRAAWPGIHREMGVATATGSRKGRRYHHKM